MAESNDKGKGIDQQQEHSNEENAAMSLLVIGMAGSGKTSFVHRLTNYLSKNRRAPYIVNLDPAVAKTPFPANIDIRDTVDYAEVMKQYNLGPNGAIMTSLNLFTTKFDQVLSLIEKRASSSVDHVVVDTPGQIEIFTWSASGTIITEALASSLPTCVVYVVDTPRTSAPATFMSNMLYACSILYKTKLPFIIVFNKTDVMSHDFAVEWMRDWESFQEALSASRQAGDDSFMGNLNHSMSLMLDEFYKHLKAVGVSAVTGQGMPEFLDAVEDARKEYYSEYKPELERVADERKKQEEKRQQTQMAKLMKDLKMDEEKKKSQSQQEFPPNVQKGVSLEPEDEDDDQNLEFRTQDEGELIDNSNAREHGLFTGKKGRGVVEDSYGARWPDDE